MTNPRYKLMDCIVDMFYRLDTEAYKFYLTITQGKESDALSIGGRKGECVNISVNKPESILVQRGHHQLDTATIPILAWDSKCAIDKDLERGIGTISMIRVLLSETLKRYPYIKKFTFRDNSLIPCDNGKQISLLHLTIIKYNMSWYESHFHASIENPVYSKKYKDGLAILNDKELKMSFDDFKNKIKGFTTESDLHVLKGYYETSSTYSLFFKAILEKEGKKRQCNLVASWIDVFLQYIFQFDPLSVPWLIHSESVPIQEVAVTQLANKPSQIGGRRYTKRNIPKVMRVNINDTFDAT